MTLTRDLADVAVPDRIQDVLMARLDRLPEEPKRAIQIASIIGREFAMRLLGRIHDTSANLEAIVGELPDEDETPDVVREGEHWLIHGTTNIHQVEQALNCDGLVSESDEYVTLAGMLLSHFGSLPEVGQQLQLGRFCFEVMGVSERRIERVRVTPLAP